MADLGQKAWRAVGLLLCIAGLGALALFGLRLCGLALSTTIRGAGLALACAAGYGALRVGCRLWQPRQPARPMPRHDVSAGAIEQELRNIKKSLGKS